MPSRRSKLPHGSELVAAIWGLRVMVRFDPDADVAATHRAAALLGCPRHPRTNPQVRRRQFVERLRMLEAVKLTRGEGLLRNADLLARRLQLTTVERDLVVLSVMQHRLRWFGSLFSYASPDGFMELIERTACALAVEVPEVKRALRRDGVLRTSQLVDFSRCGDHAAAFVPASALVEALSSAGLSARALMRYFVREAPPTRLVSEDFAYIGTDVSALTSLLRGALRRRAKGVNILLHGKPGTGKTELARVVTHAVGARLYEVADGDEDGDALDSDRRLGMCAIAHRILAQAKGTVLLFDEIEDAFPSRWHGTQGLERSSTPTKSWTHRLIERSPLPTFWIANTIQQIDPATLRRFDLALELSVPPRSVRRRMIAEELGKTVVEGCAIDRLAADERLAPAHVSRAVRVTELMGARRPADVSATLTYVLDRNLAVQGPARSALSANLACGPYDPTFVNASADLPALAESLGRASQAAICLYGPPGTGKTAWVAHLATSLGRPLRAARASDLLDCYLGGTEKNLAELFRSALAEKALLFIDEADSFLQDRSQAKRSWEVTQVNELLVQMETFQGLLVCATNLVDTLDHASLRRFALKIEFSPLRAEQRWAMFARVVGEVHDDALRAEVERLHGLTAGDFATVARQARLTGTAHHPDVLVTLLERELVLRKGGGGRSIGFGRQLADAEPPVNAVRRGSA